MKNRFKRIETTDYILAVSDEEIKDVRKYKGRYHLEKESIINIFPDYLTDLCECKLIISYHPKGNAPELDLPLLPELSVEDDIEKLSEKYFPILNIVGLRNCPNKSKREGFIKGYKSATKKYSEGDLYTAFNVGRTYEKSNHKGVGQSELIDYIQSLNQPKWFVAEMEELDIETIEKELGIFGHDEGLTEREYEEYLKNNPLKLKTTTNSQGKQVLVGTYE
jgi:hypothetical protein